MVAKAILVAAAIGIFFDLITAQPQTRLTYPEIITALQSKLPNRSFKNKAELVTWIITQVGLRKLDKPLSEDREDDLLQAGAPKELIDAIRENSPPPATPEVMNTMVDLGDLSSRAVTLVKPEYTAEARNAGISGTVTLQLRLDEEGAVVSSKALNEIPMGLTEQALAAALRTRFKPAIVNGLPSPSVGTITYNFKMDRIDPVAMIVQADELRNRDSCEKAIGAYTKVIELDPKQEKAFFGRGVCHLTQMNFDRAVSDLNTAIDLNKSDADSYYYLAIAKEYLGDAPAASSNFAKAVILLPDLSSRPLIGCLYLGRSMRTEYESAAAADEIVKSCDSALRTPPEYLTSLLHVKRGIGYLLRSDYDGAIADFESAKQSNPRFKTVDVHLLNAYSSRGLARYRKKDYEGSFDDLSSAISMNPMNPTLYTNRCAIQIHGRKDFDMAIEDCSKAIKLSARSSMAYNYRGLAYEMKNNRDMAIADYKMAISIDPGNESARANLNRVQPSVPSLKKKP